jgi:hypothetical protein
MRDLELWRNLLAGRIDEQQLLPLLWELAASDVAFRLPFSGRFRS